MPKIPPADLDSGELSYDPELGPGYFVQIRSDFTRSKAFKPLPKLLYINLLSYAAEGATAWPGQARLAEECAVSEPTLRTALDTLKAAGLITVRRRGQGQSNLYHLHKLPTLPPNPERKKLTVSPERKNLTVKKVKDLPSSPQESSVESESGKTESIRQSDSNPTPAPPKGERYDGPHSPWIAGVIEDYSRQLGDALHWAANSTQAHRCWQASGQDEAAFVEALHAAYRRTRQAQGRQGTGVIANKMAYYFQVLRDVCGLAAA